MALPPCFDQTFGRLDILVNNAGWVKTEPGGENTPLEVAEGAKTAVRLALLPADGPTGGYFHNAGRLPW